MKIVEMLIVANGNIDVKNGVSLITFPFYTIYGMSYFVYNSRIIGLLWIWKNTTNHVSLDKCGGILGSFGYESVVDHWLAMHI